MYFAGRSRGIGAQWDYLTMKKKSKPPPPKLYVLIHLGRSTQGCICEHESNRGQSPSCTLGASNTTRSSLQRMSACKILNNCRDFRDL